MKLNDYNKLEKMLSEVNETLEMIYEEIDTSVCDHNWENVKEIESWNENFCDIMFRLKSLEEELIFTFKIKIKIKAG